MAEEKIKFVQITRYDTTGHLLGSYTQRMDEASVILGEFAEAEVGERWEAQIIEMAEAEYDALPEFTGY